MFRFLYKNLSQLAKNPPNYINDAFSSPPFHQIACITTISNASPPELDRSLTVSYLKSACGLSSKSALSASKILHLKSTENSDLVLQMLKDYGFSETQIAIVVSKLPAVLLTNPNKTLKPKLEYLRSVTGSKFTNILSVNPFLLGRSLDRVIMTSVDYVNSIDPSGLILGQVLKSTNQLLVPRLNQNIEFLKEHGVTDNVILRLLKYFPRSIIRSTVKLRDAIETVQGAGVDPKSAMFAHAVGVMSYFSKSTLDRKLQLCRQLGWSEDEIALIICKQPNLLTLSDALIREKVRFFIEVAGWDMPFLSAHPVILKLDIKKRVVPRFAVLNILMLRGSLKKNPRALKHLVVSETLFYDKYIEKYKEEAPEVVKAFYGKLEFKGWGWTKEHGEAS